LQKNRQKEKHEKVYLSSICHDIKTPLNAIKNTF